MTDGDRHELFAALAELASRYPHWRVGQLLSNVAGWADASVWDVEDEQLLAAVQAHLRVKQAEDADPVPAPARKTGSGR